MEADYYEILGVSPDATAEDIRGAYFQAVRLLHPDANPDPKAHDQFIRIQEAYAVLSAPQKRQEYDASRKDENLTSAVKVAINYSRGAIMDIQEGQLLYVLLEFAGLKELDPKQIPPSVYCLVIDRSTSMQGERMDMVKSNLMHFIRLLRPIDYIMVVTFSDRAEVIVPLSKVSDSSRLDHQISMISTGGSTEIFRGLETGINLLRTSRMARSQRTLVLLTDGHTYGDEEACKNLAREASEEGITIHGIGLGADWNDEFLDNVASLTGGSAIYARDNQEMRRFFEEKARDSAILYSKNIRFDFTVDSKVELRYAYRLEPDTTPLVIEKPLVLGNLYYGKTLRVLLEFFIQPLYEHTDFIRLAEGRLLVDLAVEPNKAPQRLILRLNRPVSPVIENDLPNSALVDALARLTVYRMQEKARLEVQNGQVEEASRHLQHLATHLLAAGDRNLAHAVLIEAEHIRQSRTLSQDGGKRIKYGTRSLVLFDRMETEP